MRICAFLCALMRNRLIAVFRLISLGNSSSRRIAGGGARTHTTLRPLDFESSASANSATPALGIETIRDSRVSSTLPRCRVFCPQHFYESGTKKSAEDSGHYRRSSVCRPRGGPKISRRTIASRKLDFDPSNVARFVLKSARFATPKAFGVA
jgi:hypothetical protein